MAATFEIKRLVPGDRAAWDPLWRDYLAFYDTKLPPDIFDLTFARYTEPDRNDMLAWMAWEGATALGLVHIITHAHGWRADPVTYLQDLFTVPQARGKGVARALIQTVYEHADANGRPSVYWLTQQSNTTARALYDKVAQPTEFMKYARA